MYSAGTRSTFGSSYRRTQAATRHSPSFRDSTTATRELQLFVLETDEEHKELQRDLDQAAANAGILASPILLTQNPRSSAYPTVGPPRKHTHTHAVAFSHSITRVQGRLGRSCCAKSDTRPLRARQAVSTGAMRLGGARLISWYPGVISLCLAVCLSFCLSRLSVHNTSHNVYSFLFFGHPVSEKEQINGERKQINRKKLHFDSMIL